MAAFTRETGYISNNIVQGVITSGSYYGLGINVGDVDWTAYIHNNIVYGFDYTSCFNCSGIEGSYSGSSSYVYNNTVSDNFIGIEGTSSGDMLTKNNIVNNNSYHNFVGTLNSSSSHNNTDQNAEDGAFGSTHSTGTTTSASAGNLVDSGATFQTDGVQVGSIADDTSNTNIPMSQL